jgi:hypothetical protein
VIDQASGDHGARTGDVASWHDPDEPITAAYVRSLGECVAKLFAALRTRNYRIQLNGVLESTLRACARP